MSSETASPAEIKHSPTSSSSSANVQTARESSPREIMQYAAEDSDDELLPYYRLPSLAAKADGGRMVHPLPFLEPSKLLEDEEYLAGQLRVMRQNMSGLQQAILELSTIVKTEMKRRPTYQEI